MTKKISMNDWTYIGKYNPAAKWLRPLCSYSLTKTDNGFRRDCKIGLPVYLLLFLPVHLLQLLMCLWDGGLKEFSVQGRHLGHDYITEHGDNCGRYPMAKEIWEKGLTKPFPCGIINTTKGQEPKKEVIECIE